MIGEGGANLRVSTVGAGGRAGIAQNGFKSSGLGGVCSHGAWSFNDAHQTTSKLANS